MGNLVRLDRVFCFQDQISFLIPHEWVEGDVEDPDDYLYHAPGTDSGWLRLSLNTLCGVKNPEERLSLLEQKWIADPKAHVFREEESGNLIAKSEKASTQDGLPIHLYFWHVANVALPDQIQEAVFSYTILRDRRDEPETVETVKLVERLVSAASFSRRQSIQ